MHEIIVGVYWLITVRARSYCCGFGQNRTTLFFSLVFGCVCVFFGSCFFGSLFGFSFSHSPVISERPPRCKFVAYMSISIPHVPTQHMCVIHTRIYIFCRSFQQNRQALMIAEVYDVTVDLASHRNDSEPVWTNEIIHRIDF